MDKFYVNYVNDNTKPMSQIQDAKFVKHEVFPSDDIKSKTLLKNGFECVKFTDKMTEKVKIISKLVDQKGNDVYNDKIYKEFVEDVTKMLKIFLKSDKYNKYHTDVINISSKFRKSDSKKICYDKYVIESCIPHVHTDWYPNQSLTTIMLTQGELLDKLKKMGINKKFTSFETALEWNKFYDPIFCDIINIWIPLSDTVKNSPFGLIDIQTLDMNDHTPVMGTLMNGNKKYFDVTSRTKYNKNHKFYFKSDITIGEAYIFNSLNVAHSALENSNKDKYPERKSVEIRFLIINNTGLHKYYDVLNNIFDKDEKHEDIIKKWKID